jgi:hypothetical protein
MQGNGGKNFIRFWGSEIPILLFNYNILEQLKRKILKARKEVALELHFNNLQ